MNVTVPVPAMLAMGATLALSVFFPLVLWVVLGRRQKGFSLAVAAGTVGFLVPQVFIRLPLLQILSIQPWFAAFAGYNTVLYVLALAFTAGLFEAAGRFLVFRFLIKKPLTHRLGIAAGLGHGGIESVVLVGFTYMNNLVLSFMINGGSLPLAGQTGVLAGLLANTAPYVYLLAGYERVCTILVHMALSLLMALFWMDGRRGTGFLLCLGVHTLVDFAVPLANIYTNLWVTYGLLTLLAAAAVAFMTRSGRQKRIFT